jgi:hypothetical protein
MSHPKAWKEYIRIVKEQGGSPDPMLANFAARYRFASALDDLGLPGFADKTKHGYLVATKLAYAYSALEALERGIGTFAVKDRSQIVDFRVAKKISRGEFRAALKQIVDAADERSRAKKELELAEMQANLDSGNVRPFVEGIRNSLFHGKFTPTSSGLKESNARRKALENLANEILLGADDIFSRWLNNQTNAN